MRKSARLMTFVAGAGPTGVELAASIAHLISVTLRKNSATSTPPRANCAVGRRRFASFRPSRKSLSRKVAKRLGKLGVQVLTGVKVEKVDEEGVVAAGAHGFQAPPCSDSGVAARRS